MQVLNVRHLFLEHLVYDQGLVVKETIGFFEKGDYFRIEF